MEIVATDRLVDIFDEGFDAGIRLGERLHDGMTAVRINPRLRFSVVGSPAYFAKHAAPEIPADLQQHIGVRKPSPSVVLTWEFSHPDKTIEFEPTGPKSLDDHELMIEAALSGVALAYVWEDRAKPHIESGRLVGCLARWCAPEDWLYLYYPTRKHMSAGLQAVVEVLRVRKLVPVQLAPYWYRKSVGFCFRPLAPHIP